jgi:hypothetical protein
MPRPAHPGNDFIEDQHSTMLIGHRSQTFEKTRCWFGSSRGRLQDHSGDLIRIRIEQCLHRIQIVIAELDRHRAVRPRNPSLHLRTRDEPVINREKRLAATDRHKITTSRRPRQLDRR